MLGNDKLNETSRIERPLRRYAPLGRQLLITLGLLLASMMLAAAQTVTPTDAVVSGVVIREQAASCSQRLGLLRPGDEAPFVRAVPNWYGIRLPGGGTGYVSKRWTRLAMEQTPPAVTGPIPLLAAGEPVDWWFVFKFNTQAFPGCGGTAVRSCPFGGTVQDYRLGFSQQFVYASSQNATLTKGTECLGDTKADPVGATYDEVYNGDYYYVVWNDQFYREPHITGCGKACSAPWGHSKGLIAWNADGAGFVMQVTTPSWPGSGSRISPRLGDQGNTLGCIKVDNVLVSQHFFALKLNKDDLIAMLHALQNASVATDAENNQLVHNGGPPEVQAIVRTLGKKSASNTVFLATLSSGVTVISKPSALHVPPWQLVSAELGGVNLRVASWWKDPSKIPTTTAQTQVGCWDTNLGKPGGVEIATSGAWNGTQFGLTGSGGRNFNHAKIGVSKSGDVPYTIFGDMNQQGALNGEDCGGSQNGRGGLFYVFSKAALEESVSALLHGNSASE